MIDLFELGKFRFTLINLIDVFLVLLISIQLYKLLKGSLAFNILIGLLTIYLFGLIVRFFEMPLLEGILSQFAQAGVLAVLIVFQQEIRKFLLILGNSSFLGENKSWLNIFPWRWKIQDTFSTPFEDIVDACETLASSHTGAIIVFPKTSEMKFIGTSGQMINADISKKLLISIFNKNSPLHDGAVIISKGKIKAANCVLPVSENPSVQNNFGLRHLSAIGITEQTDAVVLVVSEERGVVSYVSEGKVYEDLSPTQMIDRLTKDFSNEMLGVS